ncbi:MAG: DUF6159 family protein [Candidatus Sulfopaludibacter sp.]|nr:DUF6159 family protein [Candidatus Sulfopaludibacter sp.]
MGWELFGWSFAVLRRNKRLMLFPLFSTAAALIALGLCLGGWQVSVPDVVRQVSPRNFLWLAPAWFLTNFLIVFFNCALAACAQAQFSGEQPTLRYGLRQAASRVAPILGWSLLSATVGLVLNAIERRASWAGKLALWLFGFAWEMATYLVLPVLIAERRGPIESIRRSAQLVRETWGDQLVAEIRFGWRGLVFFLPCLIVGVLGANGYPVLLPVAVAGFILAMAALSAARGVFEVALYRYAAGGELPAGWSPAMLPGIFPPRQLNG